MKSRRIFLLISVLFITVFLVSIFSCKQTVEEREIVAQTPVITALSSDVSTIFNKAVTLSVTAEVTDGGTLTYQWYSATEDKLKAGIVIEDGDGFSGSKSKDFMPAVSTAGIFYYYCVVTNTLQESTNCATSPRITVIVDSVINARKPVITAEPVNIKAIIPAEGTFTIGAASPDNGTLTYQWYKLSENTSEQCEGTVITDAVQNTYKVTADAAGKTGYYCVITNTIEDNGDGGKKTESITSSVAYFEAIKLKDTLNSPIFTIQPVAMNIANPSAVLSCKAAVSNDYSAFYRWYKTEDGTVESGEPVTDGWSSSSNFETPKFTEKGIYYYYCRAASFIPTEDDSLEDVTVCSDVVSVAYTGLPTLYLDTDKVPVSEITRDFYVQGSLKMVSQKYGVQEYVFKKEKEGIKGRGNASWVEPKKGFNIKFDKKQQFFNLPASKKFCIVSNYNDSTLMNNSFASYLADVIFNSEWNPHFNYVDVIMNGEYWGNYIFCEKIGISDGRLEIQNISDVEEYLQKDKLDKIQDLNGDGIKNIYDGGFIIEVDFRGDADIKFTTNKGLLVTLKDPDLVSDATLDYIKNLINAAEDALYNEEFSDLVHEDISTISKWMKYFDVDSVIDWYIINEFAKQLDSTFITSVYLYFNPADKKIHLGPIWDFDNAFGNWHRDPYDGELPTGWYTRRADGGFELQPVNWIARMCEDDLFNELVKERWNEKKSSLGLTFADNGIIRSFMDDIKVSAEYNFMRWINSNVVENTYLSEIDKMSNWLSERYIWLDYAINSL